jgi:hypothetical protein
LASGQRCPFEHPAQANTSVFQQKTPAHEGTQDPAATGTALPNAAAAFIVPQDGEFSPFSRFQRVGPSPCVDGYAFIFRGSAGRQNDEGADSGTQNGRISWGTTTAYEVEYPEDVPWRKFEKLAPYRYGDHPAHAQPHHRHLASLYARMYANLVYRDLRRDYDHFYQKPKHMNSPVYWCESGAVYVFRALWPHVGDEDSKYVISMPRYAMLVEKYAADTVRKFDSASEAAQFFHLENADPPRLHYRQSVDKLSFNCFI